MPRVNATAGNPVDNPVDKFVDNSPSPVETGPIAGTVLWRTRPGPRRTVALTWDASSDPSVTGYQVTAYAADGTTPLATQPPVTSVARQTVSGLTPGTAYSFTVAAKNASGDGPPSDPITVSTQVATDRITITSARWRSGEFRIVGTGDRIGVTVQVHRVNADGSLGAAVNGATAVVVAAAPPGIGDYSIRQRNNAPQTNPGRIFVKSSGGGIAGPFTVSNR